MSKELSPHEQMLRAAINARAASRLTLPGLPVQQLADRDLRAMARAASRIVYHRAVARLARRQAEHHRRAGPRIGLPDRRQSCFLARHPVLSAVTPVSFIAKREVAGWPALRHAGAACSAPSSSIATAGRATGSSRDEMQERLKARRHTGAVRGRHVERRQPRPAVQERLLRAPPRPRASSCSR